MLSALRLCLVSSLSSLSHTHALFYLPQMPTTPQPAVRPLKDHRPPPVSNTCDDIFFVSCLFPFFSHSHTQAHSFIYDFRTFSHLWLPFFWDPVAFGITTTSAESSLDAKKMQRAERKRRQRAAKSARKADLKKEEFSRQDKDSKPQDST